MYNAIYCEFLKLKKSYFFLIIMFFILFLPVSLYLGWLAQGQTVYWNRFVSQVEQMNFLLINIPMYTLIAAFIYTREFSCNTAQNTFSYPIGRTKIFLSKLIVIVVVTFCIVISQTLLTFLLGTFLPHQELTKEILVGHLKINLYGLLYQYAILPMAIFVALVSRNIIMPIIYGGLITIVNIGALGAGNKNIFEYIPTLYPLLIFLNSLVPTESTVDASKLIFDSSGLVLPNTSIVIAVITFVIGISACIVYNMKTDIN